MEELFSAILGPYGVAAGAVLLLIIIGRMLIGAQKEIVVLSKQVGRIPDLEEREDKLENMLDVATAGWKKQTDANAVLASAVRRKTTARRESSGQ